MVHYYATKIKEHDQGIRLVQQADQVETKPGNIGNQ